MRIEHSASTVHLNACNRPDVQLILVCLYHACVCFCVRLTGRLKAVYSVV